MSIIKNQVHKTEEDQVMGLRDRNVNLNPCLPPDPFFAVFHDLEPCSIVSLPEVHETVKRYHIDEWALDIEKATKDSVQPAFQKAVLMSLLDRFRLIYNLRDSDQPLLDFAVESTWNCPFMPTRALKRESPDRHRVLSRPKPDISIAFHLQSIIGDGLMAAIPEATRRIMIYETHYDIHTSRAFHFLMIEAEITDNIASHLQSLNSASQSLHCLYEFFNEADREEVECGKPCCILEALTRRQEHRAAFSARTSTFVSRFFKEVRVFTVVTTTRAITIRVHRACPASEPPFPSQEGRPPFQLRILHDYPLQFEHNEVVTLATDVSRERLVNSFKKIMVDYGIGQLRPLLQQAAAKIAAKFYKWEEEKGTQYVLGMRHYSHGQNSPPPDKQISST
jgi:hypothetical protein